MRLFTLLKNQIAIFSKASRGGIAVTFAILIPFMLAIMALYFDSIQLVGKQARLADAMNEGILAVTTRDSENNLENEKLLKQYLESYLPEANQFTDVSVKLQTSDSCRSYSGSAKANMNTFVSTGLVNFGDNVDVAYGSSACQGISKMINGDFVFVVDVSGSMKGKKLKELKTILKGIINEGNKTPNTRFGLVPYSNGVPVRLPGKNEQGGELAGCSVVFVPKANYKINYQYWSSIWPANYPKSVEKAAYYADKRRFQYYEYYVSPSSLLSARNVIREKYCTLNKYYGTSYGQYKYSCLSSGEGVPQSLVFENRAAYEDKTARNKLINSTFKNEVNMAHQVMLTALKGKYRNIANDESIDYEATMKSLFLPITEASEYNPIVTFYLPWTTTGSVYYRPFRKMCRMIKGTRKTFATAKVHTRLIELSGNLNDDDIGNEDEDGEDETLLGGEDDDEEEQFIEDEDIDDMNGGGLTDTMSGFMRAIPVLVKGNSTNKNIIIISDGKDNSNRDMRDKLMDTYKICEKAKDPKNYPAPTKRVGIYFILFNKERTLFKHKEIIRWRDCVGLENIYLAKDSDELKKILFDIATENNATGGITFQ